ncbi:hypothetical protein SAMN05518801_103176 [Novosphingobium sp. CF614]|uniref:hypothetical protein n=1 Tax=Novosphingobium sp. CF614 TaxID=1884364 RepID=UPI0008E4D352|nr:hypothetical protein [Novosphingobium sp. CF614]SFF91885.1 hypothetical protein SAMN05518801_103176 [Novosphingobium sp. CF614]
MRIDARNLLNRLGKNEFSYKEFEDRFTDLELWPILEALLRDPRLQTLDQVNAPAAQAVQDTRASDEQPLGALFSRYEHETNGAALRQGTPRHGDRQPGQDVRAMLRHLSELGARGEI